MELFDVYKPKRKRTLTKKMLTLDVQSLCKKWVDQNKMLWVYIFLPWIPLLKKYNKKSSK